jgi:hypothetical protein
MKTPGQLLAELLKNPSEAKKKELKEASERVLGVKVTIGGLDEPTEKEKTEVIE